MRPPSDPNRPRILGLGLALAAGLTLGAGCGGGNDPNAKGQADASGTTWYGVKTDGGTPPTMQASMTPEAPAQAPAPAQGATDGAK